MVLTKEMIIQELELLKEDDYQAFSLKLVPGSDYPILGIRVPLLRKLAKSFKSYNVKAYLDNYDFTYLEEVQLYGMILNNQKYSFQEYQKYLTKYISHIDNWAVCDIFCANIKTKEKEALWEFIQPYLISDQEFEVRFGIVTILDHFITESNLSVIIDIVEQIKITPYYVQMASAWLLATMFIKYPEYMLRYLKNRPKLDKFTYNKTLSKITDSYRVSEKYKQVLRKMHIK